MRIWSIAATAAVLVLGGQGSAVAAAAPPGCADLEGVQVGQLCLVQLSEPGYTVSISFPTDYPDQTTLFGYVKQTRDGFLNLAKTPDSRSTPYALEIRSTQFDSAVPPRSTQSVVLESYESVGGAHPTTFYETFNWDRGLRAPITIESLFGAGSDPFPQILHLVQAELTKQFGEGETISEAQGLDPNTYQNFAITDDDLIFYFDRGAVLSEAAGAFQVSIPRAPLAGLIA